MNHTHHQSIQGLVDLIRAQCLLLTWYIHESEETRINNTHLLDFSGVFRDYEHLFGVSRSHALRHPDIHLNNNDELSPDHQLEVLSTPPKQGDRFLLETPHKLIASALWTLQRRTQGNEPADKGKLLVRRRLIRRLKKQLADIETIYWPSRNP